MEAGAVTLEPHPNPSVHPLAYRRAVRRAQLLAEAEATGEELEGSDEEEGAPSWLAAAAAAVLTCAARRCWLRVAALLLTLSQHTHARALLLQSRAASMTRRGCLWRH